MSIPYITVREGKMIDFQRKQRVIRNALSGKEYTLLALDLIDPTDKVIAQVTSICNEPLVYDWLFRKMLSDKPYPPSMATGWFARGADGWAKNDHFVFAVVDQNGGIAAACDIKSADASWAEVGYWSSSNHRGVMTNAIIGLIDLAKEAGFERLFAETQNANFRSQGVLRRAGFALSDKTPHRGNHHIVFSISTQTANQTQHSTARG
ncbi:MAG: GNAT family N-acetyltransferase [Opitutales bacterium]|nr:GNAT family N-acetyltransferase [Opitutales bacterium]